MKIDMNRVLVETAICKTLKNVQVAPERTIRNLVDLGLEFSNGRFQKQLLRTAQEMLRNENSAYYTLLKKTVASVQHEILTTFGLNLGYHGCTRGAELIRKIEAKQGFNIPWSLKISLNAEKGKEDPGFYPSILQQGVSLGIHTYLLFVAGDPEMAVSLLEGQPDCAFILFLHGNQVNDAFLEKMNAVRNTMISIYADEEMLCACRKLQDAGQLYGVYWCYSEQDQEKIISGDWLRSILPAHPTFALLSGDSSCAQETEQNIYQNIIFVREGQQYPVILFDLKYDVLAIDQIISEDECLVGFDMDGNLQTHRGISLEKQHNIFNNCLEDILSKIPKSK